MTMPSVALCADAVCLQHPETMGLAGENLPSQAWLRLFSSAEEARTFLREDRLVDEVWVVSSEDVAPVNLAATLKSDRPDRVVCMLAFQESGSLKSRVSATGIDAFLTRQAFLGRYAQRKRRAAAEAVSASGARVEGPARAGDQAFSIASAATASAASAAASAPTCAFQDFAASRTRSFPGASSASAVAVRSGSAFLMPVVSGSGGAGKSSISTIAALLSQGLGFDTLLIDFDLQFGDVSDLLGVRSPLRIEDALAAPARLSGLRPEGRMPALLAAPERLEDAEAVVQAAPQLLDELMKRFDVIVCNTGAAWAEQHAVLLERSSKALFLIDQRPSSLRACQHALDLCVRCGIATSPFLFALNRCAKNAPLTSIDVSCALQGAHVAEVRNGGRDVEELLGAGMPFDLLESKNDLCTSLERLMLEVLPNASAVAGESLFGARGSGLRLLKGRRSRGGKRGSSCL